jgi:NAD(P)-dependent dehydrogenase (short-subunit alcohol dehydrogenase family)
VQIVERAIAEHGRLDILVNNAGGAMPAAYFDTTPEVVSRPPPCSGLPSLSGPGAAGRPVFSAR